MTRVYIAVTGVMTSESIQKLVCKIGNIEDIVRVPDFAPCRIVSEDDDSCVLEPMNVWKPGWPKGTVFRMRPGPFCGTSQPMDKNDVDRGRV